MLTLNEAKELKREFGEEKLFELLMAEARGECPDELEKREIDPGESRRFMTAPQPEIFSVDRFATSSSLADLAFKILDIKNGDRVSDLCCGSGAFLLSAMPKRQGALYFGIERDEKAARAAEERLSLYLCAAGAKIFNCDLFDAPDEKFDKIYCEPPFRLRFDEEKRGMEFLCQELPEVKSLRRSVQISGCWSYIYKAASMLADGGRAVCVMAGGPLLNSFDAPLRRDLAEKGLIEAVVALPGGITTYSPVAPVLIVLGRGGGSVMMADARNAGAIGRRRKRLEKEQIEEIAAMLSEESGESRRVSLAEMEQKEWQLYPERYLRETQEAGRMARLEDFAAIIRGAMLSAPELEKLSEGERRYSVINYADIRDGLLSEKLHGISELPRRYEDCVLRDGDVVISKTGEPVRCAVIDGREDEKIVPTSNFYIIRIKDGRLDPFYLKACLESSRAKKIFEWFATGSVTKTLSTGALRDFPIPCLEAEKMREIASRCREIEKELRAAKEKVKQIKKERASLFDAR